MSRLLSRDEREIGVDRAADRLAYVVVSYGLLLVVAYRSFVHGEAPWDLLALVVLGGAVGTAYRVRMRATSGRWLSVVFLAAVLAALIAAALVLGLR